MPALIIVIAIVVIIAIWGFTNKNNDNNNKSSNNNQYKEIIEQRKKFVTSFSPTARIIVNNGIHLFFMDDTKQVFGVDDSGTTYSYLGVKGLSTGNTYVNISHENASWYTLELGKSNSSKEGAVPIDSASISLITDAILPIARKNIHEKLKDMNIMPTHEYVNRGEIWGCDINSHKFYFTYGYLYICDFSKLVKVEFDDFSSNSDYFGFSYRIYVTIKSDYREDDEDFWINVDDNITLNNLLAMFKGIKNRQNYYDAPIAQKSFDTMEGHEFEYFCANLLRKSGYENVNVTQGSGDQGIDIIAYREGIKYGIQCKCYSSDIGNKAIQEVFAGKTFYECHVGVVLTNRYFTKSAVELAQKNGIILWDRDKLISMIDNS